MRSGIAVHGKQGIIHVVHFDIFVGGHTYAYIVLECCQHVFGVVGETSVDFHLPINAHVELVVRRVHRPVRTLAVHFQGDVQRFGNAVAIGQIEHFVIRSDVHAFVHRKCDVGSLCGGQCSGRGTYVNP